jgi:hypothetical protein
MTRFQREISGQLGDYWLKSAQEEVEKAVENANENAIVESDGAIKWKSNGSYIPDDFCEKLEYAKYFFSRKATADKRDQQLSEFIKNYINSKRELSQEEKIELDANNEPGTSIVDVISGRKYITK